MKILLPFVYMLFSIGLFAHSDITYSKNTENIHFEYKTGWTEFEIGHKVDILLELATKLAKIKGYSEHIYIYFGHDYTHTYSPHIALGYEKFTYWRTHVDDSSPIATETGINLSIYDKDIDIREVLTLLHAAITHIDSIKVKQYKQIIELSSENHRIPLYDTVYSIPPSEVLRYLTTADTIIDKLISDKIYRSQISTEVNRVIDYYYQNNKFHFYNTEQFEGKESQEGSKFGKDILVVDNILEIIGEPNRGFGYFIFINDSVFYFIPHRVNKVDGPYTIDSIKAGRPPISKSYTDFYPIKKQTFVFNIYSPYYTKALFFPDSNLVISNYHKLENNLINEILKNGTDLTTEKASHMPLLLFVILLAGSIALNIWLLIKRIRRNTNETRTK